MMCGASEAEIAPLRPLLATMASSILPMGKPGSGQLAKLINQLLFDINAAALAEVLPLAVKLGLEPDKVGKIVNSGTGRSYASEFFIPNILKGDFSKGYPMSAAYKDLVSGRDFGTPYHTHARSGGGNSGLSVRPARRAWRQGQGRHDLPRRGGAWRGIPLKGNGKQR